MSLAATRGLPRHQTQRDESTGGRLALLAVKLAVKRRIRARAGEESARCRTSPRLRGETVAGVSICPPAVAERVRLFTHGFEASPGWSLETGAECGAPVWARLVP